MATVCGAYGSLQPGPGAFPGQGPAGARPAGGVYGGEPSGGPQDLGEVQGSLGGQVPIPGGYLVGGVRGTVALLRVPLVPLALSSGHQPHGAVYPGDKARDEGAGP